MPWLMLLPMFIVEDGISYGQMLLPIFYHLADVIALFITVVGVTLHYKFSLIMADVIAKWQDGTTTFFVLLMADVVAMWQDGTATFILRNGRCYCHVADGKATV